MWSQAVYKFLFPSLTWNLPTSKPGVYLTFDDGPIPEITPWVLELLEKYHAKATFFCIGENVIRHRDIFNSIIRTGHTVGNHTHNHLNGWRVNAMEYKANIDLAAKEINNHASLSSVKLFRPPYGKITPAQVRQIKPDYQIIMWDVLTRDFDTSLSKEACFERVKKHAKSGSILVFHDSAKSAPRMKYCLEKTLDYFTAKDFNFYSIGCS